MGSIFQNCNSTSHSEYHLKDPSCGPVVATPTSLLLPPTNLVSISIRLSLQEPCTHGVTVCHPVGLPFSLLSIMLGDASRLLPISIACSCGLLKSVPWNGCARACFAICLLKDIRLFPVWGYCKYSCIKYSCAGFVPI